MKTRQATTILLLLMAYVMPRSARAQPSQVHRFAAITMALDRAISLTVTNEVPAPFLNYYDLFPIETSHDLLNWKPLVTLFRTNRMADPVGLVDQDAANQPLRFYRTPTNQLFTAIPAPDGPYSVGVVSRVLTDPSRTDRYVPGNSSFMASIWYPAQATAGTLPGLYVDPQIAALGGVFCFTAHYGLMHGHARVGLPLATNESTYPLVIYSHGQPLTRTDNTRKVENLASYGFIVLAVDHINCAATVFPDGTLLRGTYDANQPGDPIAIFVANDREQDVSFVLDQAAGWNAADPLLGGHLNLGQVGIFGHSFGGGTSSTACAQEPRVKAGLSLDGGSPSLPIPAFDRPFLILSGGDNNAYMQQFRDAYLDLFNRLSHDAYWAHLADAVHCNFNDTPWFEVPTTTFWTRRALAQDRYVVSFFRKYLRNEDDHFLDVPPADWPEVDTFLKK